MIARDTTLSALYDARDTLADLIVGWAPDPQADAQVRAEQARQLKQLILQRDHINGAINDVILTKFQNVATPELLAAAQELRATTDRLEQFGKAVDELNAVIRVADDIVGAAAKVIKLVAAV
jgi:hypothetical protein